MFLQQIKVFQGLLINLVMANILNLKQLVILLIILTFTSYLIDI